MPILVHQVLPSQQQVSLLFRVRFGTMSVELSAESNGKATPFGSVDEPVKGSFQESAVDTANFL